MLEESLSHSEWLDVWKQTHPNTWKRYSDNADNEKLLLESVRKYRACETGCRRGFADIQSQLVRTDGNDAEWDCQQVAQRKASQEAQLDAEATADPAFIEHIMSLGLPDLQQAYYGDSDFARRYRVAVRDHGFRIPPRPAMEVGR